MRPLIVLLIVWLCAALAGCICFVRCRANAKERDND